MDSAEVYVSAIQSILESADFRSTMSNFIEQHAPLFEDCPRDEYGHGHFEVFHDYRRLAESKINAVLAELGGSLSQLEKQVDRRLDRTPRSPLDMRQRNALADFMAFESFETFGEMMVRRAHEARNEADHLRVADFKSSSRVDHEFGNFISPEEALPEGSSYNRTPSSSEEESRVKSQLEAMGFSAAAASLAWTSLDHPVSL